MKSGVVRAVSIGFDPDFKTAIPLNPSRPHGGMRFVKSELLELSIVSVGADPGATVVARSASSRAAFLRRIDALPPISPASIARAAAIVPQSRPGRILSHAGHVWTLLQQSEHDKEERRRNLPDRATRVNELEQRHNRTIDRAAQRWLIELETEQRGNRILH